MAPPVVSFHEVGSGGAAQLGRQAPGQAVGMYAAWRTPVASPGMTRSCFDGSVEKMIVGMERSYRRRPRAAVGGSR